MKFEVTQWTAGKLRYSNIEWCSFWYWVYFFPNILGQEKFKQVSLMQLTRNFAAPFEPNSSAPINCRKRNVSGQG